ncbi:MAG TPA: protein kinase [Pyrinomonadaceae bacterium]|nr:protein kinase [Pyrinomonadaceae bacterium]
MDAARWKQIDELLDAALEIPEADRYQFVTERAGNDIDLRVRVLELLKAQSESDKFLNNSAMHIAAKAVADDDTVTSAFGLINKKIATYRIEKQLGAGGMGEVYLAFDEKMKRKVALKILPAEYLTNDERVKRFELEARAVSSLNHPGIVTIYDVGNFQGVNYIATEFVEGKTLRDLMGGKFKLRNILLNSIQICDALSAAHNAGIVHRDIKPENVMIRQDGYAKILDFGLAKLTDPGQQTMRNMAATTKGVIIGTPAYMSPAQVTDDEIDHRTDLWSCGVVLYEFLTGRNPFKGSNRQETFEAILTRNPDASSSLNSEIPEELDRILAKLLEKDPAMGYQSAADLRADLKRVKREVDSSPSWSTEGFVKVGSSRSSLSLAKLSMATAGLLILITGALAVYFFFKNSRDPDAIDWAAAKSVQLTDAPGTEFFPSISPDGKDLVYAAEENGGYDIFTQRVNGKNRRNLTENSPAVDTQPAFSPDGELIAFRSERTPKGIYVMGASGENLRHVSADGFHPSWSPNGKEIVVSSFGRDEPTVRADTQNILWVINVANGEKRELAKVEASFPTWSPNGHRIAYWFYTGTFGRRDIATIPAGGGDPVIVAKDFAVSNWNPVWSPDGKYLYFVSSKSGNMNFWRVRIDERTGESLSDPEAVITPAKYSRHLSFSKDGKRMVYVQTNNRSNIQGVELDPQTRKPIGQATWITQGDRQISRAELSPDGTQFVTRLNKPNQEDIVTVSRDGREWRDVTNDESFERYIRWSPDGKQLAFGSDRNGGGQVWISNADGTNLRQLSTTTAPQTSTGFPVWSPAGDRLAVYFDGTTTLLDPTKRESEQQAPKLPRINGLGIVVWDWSPDGKKLLGVIQEGAKRHIGYFDMESNEYRIIVDGVNEVPSWFPDSRHFVYSRGSKVFITEIESGETKELFSNPEVEVRSPFVSRDGKLLYYTAGNSESDIWLLDIASEK